MFCGVALSSFSHYEYFLLFTLMSFRILLSILDISTGVPKLQRLNMHREKIGLCCNV